MTVTRILTHPGSAHKDELLASAILLTEYRVPIHRVEPTAADLENPACIVLDVGHRHEPELNNYDHHQFSRNAKPTCSVSLALEAIGLYADACTFLDWIEPTEWFDCRGPAATADWLGVDRRVLPKLHSPIDGAILRAFSRCECLEPGDFLWETLRLIGEDIVGFLRRMRNQLQFLSSNTEVWTVQAGTESFNVLYLPRSEEMPDDPTLGIGRFIEEHPLSPQIVGTVYPDRRGEGYGLSRYRDDQRLNFNRINEAGDVHFTHSSGFLAKTTATDPDRLRALLIEAWNSSSEALASASL